MSHAQPPPAPAHIDHLRTDQALNNTLGQGIGYGFAAAAAELAPEFVALRLAGGLRWAGATRAAVVATRLAEQVSWAGTEGELIGIRSAWQGLRKAPGQALSRVGFDVVGQGVANGISSNNHGWERFDDGWQGINGIETVMAGYGLRPFAVSMGSAAFQWSRSKGYQSIFNSRVSPRAFLAQAAIGTVMGHFGEYTGGILNRHLAYRLYQGAILRLGENVAYPVWLGSSQLFKKAVPASFGVAEEYSEGVAQDHWRAEGERP